MQEKKKNMLFFVLLITKQSITTRSQVSPNANGRVVSLLCIISNKVDDKLTLTNYEIENAQVVL